MLTWEEDIKDYIKETNRYIYIYMTPKSYLFLIMWGATKDALLALSYFLDASKNMAPL